MKNFKFLSFLAPLLLSLCLFAHAEDTAQDLLKSADSTYLKRTDLAQATQAFMLYEKAVAENPQSVEALWKTSRAAWWMADHTASTKEKIVIFQKGIDYAKAAVALDPNSADAHFWLGGNYGSFGEAKGVMKSLFLVKPIRHEMAEVLRIDPNYNSGGGYRVLGVVDYKVPGIAGGNKKRALENLNKALSLDPQNSFNQYYLAEYFMTVGEKDKAQEHLAILKSLTASEEQQPDLLMMQAKGTALEAKIKK